MKNQTNITSLAIITAALLIAGAFLLDNKNQNNSQQNNFGSDSDSSIIRQTNETQIVKILARGGYNPHKIIAQAGKPLTIEMETKGTYDCSSALVIPSLKYRKQLPPSGTTTIEIPAQPPGATIQGLCAMGMYSFTVEFK